MSFDIVATVKINFATSIFILTRLFTEQDEQSLKFLKKFIKILSKQTRIYFISVLKIYFDVKIYMK